ncbi:MAG: hypothetical protein GYA55_11735 [SAR324 cluster bacterium]|uniref:LysM domain-containing protein n=1 Tax=SAR324 cluster bacterium TaxID=2024889 RepID=A0A7X9IMA8_9DELT|nr:hypothetical protein [SAR324 cluster bacterium]
MDKGPLPLSTTNPYLGTNLFLSNEFQKSPELFNFLKGRGAPSAIDIKESGVEVPTMRMFYTQDKQMYIAELQQIEPYYQWIVRGPYAITRIDYRRLPKESSIGSQEALFIYEGREYRFREAPQESAKTIVSLKVPEAPKKKFKPRPKAAKVIKSEGNVITTQAQQVTPALEIGSNTSMNLDQQALQMAKSGTIQSPKVSAVESSNLDKTSDGDVIHIVKRSNQTMKEVVEWYIGSMENAEEIAKKNGVALDTPLPEGKKILIPGLLVKQSKAMPQ